MISTRHSYYWFLIIFDWACTRWHEVKSVRCRCCWYLTKQWDQRKWKKTNFVISMKLAAIYFPNRRKKKLYTSPSTKSAFIVCWEEVGKDKERKKTSAARGIRKNWLYFISNYYCHRKLFISDILTCGNSGTLSIKFDWFLFSFHFIHEGLFVWLKHCGWTSH